MKLIEDLIDQASALDITAEATESQGLKARLFLCAKLMRHAAKVLSYPPESETTHIPHFLRKQAH